MNKIGIIMECNPYHNGHQYFINKIKKEYNPDYLIAITSGYFTMRGDISTINKIDKTKSLLKGGVNLVLELPAIYSLQSSDYFAFYSVKTLAMAGINTLICGCETDDLSSFDYFYNLINDSSFKKALDDEITKNKSYKVSYALAFKKLGVNESLINLFNAPNFTLAFQYYKVIKDNNLNIKFLIIKRTNNFNDKQLSDTIASAEAIREGLINKVNIDKYLPYQYDLIDLKSSFEEIFKLFKYNSTFINASNYDEGILNYIKKYLNTTSFYDLIEATCNKRYTKSHIKRAILKYLLDATMDITYLPYIRILGLDDLGKYYISTLPKDTKSLIFTSIQDGIKHPEIESYLKIELRASLLYETVTNQSNIKIKEYQLPIRKENI